MIKGGNKNWVGGDYVLCFFKALWYIISFSKDRFVDVAVVAIVFCIAEEKFDRIIFKKRKKEMVHRKTLSPFKGFWGAQTPSYGNPWSK